MLQKSNYFATCVNGAAGDDDIASMWKTYFEHNLLLSLADSHHKCFFESRIKAANTDNWISISMDDIIMQ